MCKCLNCEKEVKRKTRFFCSNKCRGEYKIKENPTEKYTVTCFICGEKFEVFERKNKYPSKEKYYCSRNCANKRIHSEETKKKISDGIKGVYIKDTTYADRCKNNNKRNKIKDGIYSKVEIICIGCGKNFLAYQCVQDRKFCSKDCYHKNIKRLYKTLNDKTLMSGGYRGSSPERGKCGWYKNYWCDSSWELAWIIYNLDHDIKFKRNNEKFEYIFNGKKLNYIPDFKIDDNYIEIKGYESNKDMAKFEYFPHKLTILKRNDLYDIFKYVRKKYGYDYVKLYENVIFNVKEYESNK